MHTFRFVGLFVALVWGLSDWAANHKLAPRYLAVAVTIWTFALALSAHAQMKYWANTTDLWSHTLEVTGPNFVAEDNLGAELIKEGKIEAARRTISDSDQHQSKGSFQPIEHWCLR